MKKLCMLFLQTSLLIMAGFVLCNVSAIVINDLFDGFGSFLEQICNLPYILYAIFSLVISLVLTLILGHKTR